MASMLSPVDLRKQKALLARLARVEGQIRGIRRMIEEDADCEAVAQQLAASRKALNKAFFEMMACTIERDVMPDEDLDEASREKLYELTRLLAKYDCMSDLRTFPISAPLSRMSQSLPSRTTR